tara:strand:- start:507 stop:641 length:135 start_codon:yes stop_codon:yes gene_type:complete
MYRPKRNKTIPFLNRNSFIKYDLSKIKKGLQMEALILKKYTTKL